MGNIFLLWNGDGNIPKEVFSGHKLTHERTLDKAFETLDDQQFDAHIMEYLVPMNPAQAQKIAQLDQNILAISKKRLPGRLNSRELPRDTTRNDLLGKLNRLTAIMPVSGAVLFPLVKGPVLYVFEDNAMLEQAYARSPQAPFSITYLLKPFPTEYVSNWLRLALDPEITKMPISIPGTSGTVGKITQGYVPSPQ